MTRLDKHLVESRLSWSVDKILLGIAAFFGVKTYNTLEILATKVQELETKVAVLQQAIKHTL